ncbi:hypothetical protein ACF08N_37730 [Streptomyces sp. NPDC015127]|uniref:hypothetical protein n=1 Tax=Streptomyces sp. NPDC015127 TaxID=3364939 RepID=UPI0037021386
MVFAIVDVLYELSERCAKPKTSPAPCGPARRGVLAAEQSEMLYRQLFLAHSAAGDIDALREAAVRLTCINEHLLGGGRCGGWSRSCRSRLRAGPSEQGLPETIELPPGGLISRLRA